MAPMKSSREMAVAQSSGNTRKRFASDIESDNDGSSDSDYSMTKAGGGRSRAKKKPRNANPIKTSSHDSHSPNKPANSTAATLTGIKLPKEMACPNGTTPFSKAHWKAIAQTDDFWEYLEKMIPPTVLKRRLDVSIKIDLNAQASQNKEAREAREAKTRLRHPSAVKGGPVHLPFEARDGDLDSTQQPGSRDTDEIANRSTNVGQARIDEDQIQEDVEQAKAKGSGQCATAGSKGILKPEKYRERMKEQKTILAQTKADNAMKENEVDAEGAGVGARNTGSEADLITVDNRSINLPHETDDPVISVMKREDSEEGSKDDGQQDAETATTPPPKTSDTDQTAEGTPVSKQRNWDLKEW